ncbi:MAG: MATE family efflux transporter, partial [Intestinibacter sp.]
MKENKSLETFASMPVSQAVIQNIIPAVVAMLMVLIYNLADTFFIGQTHDAYQVAAVSLATPVF